MKHLMMIALFTGLLTFTGCASHRAGGNCNSCQSGQCQSGQCGQSCNGDCQEGGGGLFGRMGSGGCESCQGGVPVGCRPGPLHWQQGGLDYAGGLSSGLGGSRAGQVMNAQPVNQGPPSGTVAYPYYTHRGPRDFLLDNPPSIGR